MADPATRIIDVHSHSFLPLWHEQLRARGLSGNGQAGTAHTMLPSWSEDETLRMMDRHGIETSILSIPNASPLLIDPQAGTIARRINEEFARIIERHPGRFGAFAVTPQHDLDAMTEETIHALDVLHLDGIGTSTHINGIYLGEPPLDAWFQELNKRRALLFAHPCASPVFSASSMGLHPSLLDFMFDTTRAITNLVFSGRKQRFADIRIISTHGGGTIPYLAHRLSLLEPIFGPGPGRPMLCAEEVRAGFASFFYDLTACLNPASLHGLQALVPATQLLMGFDYPMMPESLIAPALKSFDAYGGFDAGSRHAIVRGNAQRLLPRLSRAAR